MLFFIRFIITILILVIAHPFIQVGQYTSFALTLALLGTIALIWGPYLTGSGFMVGSAPRRVMIDRETPGCVWKVWGWMCWILVAIMVLTHKCCP